MKSTQFAGDYSDADAYTYDKRKIRVSCPECKYTFSALSSKNTTKTGIGVRQKRVGRVNANPNCSNIDCPCLESYTNFTTICPKCKQSYSFTVYAT